MVWMGGSGDVLLLCKGKDDEKGNELRDGFCIPVLQDPLSLPSDGTTRSNAGWSRKAQIAHRQVPTLPLTRLVKYISKCAMGTEVDLYIFMELGEVTVSAGSPTIWESAKHHVIFGASRWKNQSGLRSP